MSPCTSNPSMMLGVGRSGGDKKSNGSRAWKHLIRAAGSIAARLRATGEEGGRMPRATQHGLGTLLGFLPSLVAVLAIALTGS